MYVYIWAVFFFFQIFHSEVLVKQYMKGLHFVPQGYSFFFKLGHTFSKNSMATQDIIAVAYIFDSDFYALAKE